MRTDVVFKTLFFVAYGSFTLKKFGTENIGYIADAIQFKNV